MPYQQFGGGEDAVRKQMMIFELMRKGGVSRGQTEIDKFLEQLDKDEKEKTQEQRLQRESNERIIDLGVKQERLQTKEDFANWYKEQERLQKEKDDASQAKLRESQGKASEAAAKHSLAGAESAESTAKLNTLKGKGEQEKQTREMNEGLLTRARIKWNTAVGMVKSGMPLSPHDTDQAEEALKILKSDTGEEVEPLPRDGSGRWAPDLNKPLITFDKDYNPTFSLDKGLQDVQNPFSGGFAKDLADLNNMKDRGYPPEQIAMQTEKLMKSVRGSLKDQQSKMVEWYFRNGFTEEGEKAMIAFTGGGKQPKVQLPSAAERAKMQEKGNMLSLLDSIESQYNTLVERGIVPVGYLRQPWDNLFAKFGTIDPGLQNFRKDLERFKGKYVFSMSGMNTREKEPEQIARQIPYLDDSPATFIEALPHYREMLTREIGISNAIAKSYGMAYDKDGPMVDLPDMLRKGVRIKDFMWDEDNGYYVPADQVKNHILGIENLGKAKENVGSIEEFRDYKLPADQSTEEGIGQTTAPAAPPPPRYKDPKKAEKDSADFEEIKKKMRAAGMKIPGED